VPKTLLIRVECEDESDLDWLRHRCVALVEEEVEDNKDDSRLDGKVEVSWEIED
jgi:predicted secreted protein